MECQLSSGAADPPREGYLAPPDLHAANYILPAAALTYVASSLFSLVNMRRWIQLVRY
ncbi:zinc metallopeptidase [Nitrospira sp. Ecomares 2.1]